VLELEEEGEELVSVAETVIGAVIDGEPGDEVSVDVMFKLGEKTACPPVGITQIVSVLVIPTTTVVVAVMGRRRSSSSRWIDARTRRGRKAKRDKGSEGNMSMLGGSICPVR
jgi:hypothetical protein